MIVKRRSLSLALSRLSWVFWLLAVVGLVLTTPALLLAGIMGVAALITLAHLPGVGAFALETAAMASRPSDQLAASFPALSTVAPSRPLAPGHRPPRALLAD